MERKQTKRYRLIDLESGRVWDSNSARVIIETMFVLTIWPPHGCVYKYGVCYHGRLFGEVSEVARALEAWTP